MLIGGYAVGVYGYPRTTNDIDVFVSDDGENVGNLVKALQDFGFEGFDLSGISPKNGVWLKSESNRSRFNL